MKKLNESIYTNLKRRIISNQYAPGMRIDEKEIAVEEQTSRTPVREALLALEREGLVQIMPRNGIYVSEIDLVKIIKILRVKARLEGLAAELATDNIAAEDVIQLKNLLKSMESINLQTQNEQFEEEDACFHKLIRDKSNNDFLIEELQQMESVILRAWNYYAPLYPKLVHTADHLSLVIDAFEKKDPVMAGKQMEKHSLLFLQMLQQVI